MNKKSILKEMRLVLKQADKKRDNVYKEAKKIYNRINRKIRQVMNKRQFVTDIYILRETLEEHGLPSMIARSDNEGEKNNFYCGGANALGFLKCERNLLNAYSAYGDNLYMLELTDDTGFYEYDEAHVLLVKASVKGNTRITCTERLDFERYVQNRFAKYGDKTGIDVLQKFIDDMTRYEKLLDIFLDELPQFFLDYLAFAKRQVM